MLIEGEALISEESDQYQYRFQKIVEPDTNELLFELEHEVRALSHQMYRRPLVNRNPETNFSLIEKVRNSFPEVNKKNAFFHNGEINLF